MELGYFFMPNRVLRDWTASESIDLLTPGAEVFFTRLIMKADDYGNHTANKKLVKAALFPLKDYSLIEIGAWINECEAAGIVRKYEVDGKEYIHIVDFGQRLRTMVGKCPQPADNPPSDDSNARSIDGLKRSRNEVEEETEVETEVTNVFPTFDNFWEAYGKKVDRIKCEAKWKKIPQVTREKIMAHVIEYVKSTPDPQYRKNPATYLNNESWNNEIIRNGNTAKQITRDDRNRYIDAKYGTAGTAKG